MKVINIFAIYLLLTHLLCGTYAVGVTKFVVLMMENRSFDHLLGWLSLTNPKIDGLNGTECNHEDANDEHSKKYCVDKKGTDKALDDPSHDLNATSEQIFGFELLPDKKGVPKMNGFVQNAIHRKGHPGVPMSMFTKETDSAPIINTLATEFAVFDKWHASLPGPTDPNRAFIMSGTSNGLDVNFNGHHWEQQSYFDFLTKHNVSWNAYYDHNTWAIFYFKDTREKENVGKIFPMKKFFENVKNGKLETFTFLQPRMTASTEGPPNWQHPDASVREGERLIKEVYEALSNSKFWDEVAFILTYDEHGGFYDHVAPPQEGIPNPDGKITHDGFRFDRLGIRVPTVVASPLIPKGLVVGKPNGPHPTSQYEHTSVMSTVNKIIGIEKHLTDRAAWSGTFENIFSLDKPRTDCPKKLPDLPMWTKQDLLKQGNLPLNEHIEIEILFYCKENNHDMETCGKDIKNQRQATRFIETERKIFLKQFEDTNSNLE